MTPLARRLFDWVLLQRQAVNSEAPFMIGISGAQGIGKSTLCTELVALAHKEGLSATTLSLDDFYLPRAAQVDLARAHSANEFLQVRGYPLTHDLPLAQSTLQKLAEGDALTLPSYDKSAHQGHGDRCPVETWSRIETPQDLVFFEGWMVGFEPVAENHPALNPDLRICNRALVEYQALWQKLQALIWLLPAHLQDIPAWRVEAEQKRRAAGEGAMTEAETRAYIDRFLVAYRIYLNASSNSSSRFVPSLRVTLGSDRLPLSFSNQ